MAKYQMNVPTALTAQATFLVADDPAEWNKALADKIAGLRAERDALGARLDRGADYLATLQQDSPEFERWFGEWERILTEHDQLGARIDCFELTMRIREAALT